MLGVARMMPGCTPVHYFSHGTPSMIGEESESADYWEHCGKLALRHGVKHIIIMAGSDHTGTHQLG